MPVSLAPARNESLSTYPSVCCLFGLSNVGFGVVRRPAGRKPSLRKNTQLRRRPARPCYWRLPQAKIRHAAPTLLGGCYEDSLRSIAAPPPQPCRRVWPRHPPPRKYGGRKYFRLVATKATPFPHKLTPTQISSPPNLPSIYVIKIFMERKISAPRGRFFFGARLCIQEWEPLGADKALIKAKTELQPSCSHFPKKSPRRRWGRG